MDIVIFSGGTGSIALQNGLKDLMPRCKITNIINAYDDGKSTGVCRKILNILGPSDIRKNHETQYRNQHRDNINMNIIEFMTSRFDLPKGYEANFCKEMLALWSMPLEFNNLIDIFFDSAKTSEYVFNDFNIANIIYSSLFATEDYNDAIMMMANYLNISDNVILNSFDNVKLNAVVKQLSNNEYNLTTEESIVNFNKHKNEEYIDRIFFTDFKTNECVENIKLNPAVEIAINEADLIIYAPGTQWSSLLPTYMTDGLKLCLKNSKVKKIMVMNISNDSDMIGWSSEDIVKKVSEFVPIDYVLIANDADNSLNHFYGTDIKSINTIIRKKLRYNNTKLHDPNLLAKNIFAIYFNLLFDKKPDLICFDFDDTLWSRDENNKLSRENVILLNKIAENQKVAIVSGNSYNSIHSKLSTVFGGALDINFDIWADGGMILYSHNFPIYVPNELYIDLEIFDNVKKLINKCSLDYYVSTKLRGILSKWFVLSIKPIENNIMRKLLVDYLNLYFENNYPNYEAIIAGRTTIDIKHKQCDKVHVLDYYSKKHNITTYYIGDECDSGNDTKIAKACSHYFQVKNLEETNIILNLIGELEYA